MHGFHGQLLHIDLNCGKSSWLPLEEARLRAFLSASASGPVCSTTMLLPVLTLSLRLTR